MPRSGKRSTLHLVLGGVMGLGALVALKVLWDTFFVGNNVAALGALAAACGLSFGAWRLLGRRHSGPPSKPGASTRPADTHQESAQPAPKKKKGKKKRRRRR
jgi:hypothetical protein